MFYSPDWTELDGLTLSLMPHSRYQSFILIIQEFAKFEGIIVAILFIILSFEEIIVVCICNRAEFNSSVTDMKIIPTTGHVCFFSSFAFSLSYDIIVWEF